MLKIQCVACNHVFVLGDNHFSISASIDAGLAPGLRYVSRDIGPILLDHVDVEITIHCPKCGDEYSMAKESVLDTYPLYIEGGEK